MRHMEKILNMNIWAYRMYTHRIRLMRELKHETMETFKHMKNNMNGLLYTLIYTFMTQKLSKHFGYNIKLAT